MNTDELQQMAWDAEDSGDEVYVYRHHTQDDVITCVEINGEAFENEFLDMELEPYDFYAERMWQE